MLKTSILIQGGCQDFWNGSSNVEGNCVAAFAPNLKVGVLVFCSYNPYASQVDYWYQSPNIVCFLVDPSIPKGPSPTLDIIWVISYHRCTIHLPGCIIVAQVGIWRKNYKIDVGNQSVDHLGNISSSQLRTNHNPYHPQRGITKQLISQKVTQPRKINILS